MNFFSNLQFTKENYFNLLISLIPVSFIAGNMLININILIIIFSALIVFGKNLFKINYFFLDKIIFLFFILILFTGVYNDIEFFIDNAFPKGIHTILKSIFFLKYLLLYIVIRSLIEKKNLNLKFFFISCAFFSLFVCFDIFYQFIFGKDIFGLEITNARKLSGPFGDELIAGSYLQRFSLFLFFLVPLYYKKYLTNYFKYLLPILFIVCFVAIILSGNRMPLLLFLFTIFLTLIFQKQARKYFLHFLVIFPVVFLIIYNSNSQVKINFDSLSKKMFAGLTMIVNNDLRNENTPDYLKEFISFHETWKMNRYIGGGIKNFRYYCHIRPNIDKNRGIICNMHPHNYYLEILTETGIVGLTIVLSIFLITLYYTFYKKYFSISKLNNNNIIIPFIFLFIAEIFPLKSTGSFFTTGNTTYLFFILAILISLANKDKSIEKNT
jgi:O-antigen ligase